MNHIAQAIYVTRLQKGLTQRELALKTGIPQPNLSRIEKGRDFKVSTLHQVAMALDVSVEDLVRGVAPLIVNKKTFFQRDNIERVVNCIAKKKTLPKGAEQVGDLVTSVMGSEEKKGYVRQGDVYISWAKLRSTFSGDEIKAIFSRVEKARRRLA